MTNLHCSSKLLSLCRTISSEEADLMKNPVSSLLPIHVRWAVKKPVQLQQLGHAQVEKRVAASL